MKAYRFEVKYGSYSSMRELESWSQVWDNADPIVVAENDSSAIQELFKFLLDTVRLEPGEYLELHDDIIVVFAEEGVPVEAILVRAIGVDKAA